MLVVIIVPSGTFQKDGIRRPELTYFCSGGNASLSDNQVIVGEGYHGAGILVHGAVVVQLASIRFAGHNLLDASKLGY